MTYNSTRRKAYRNLLVCAINEGLRRKLLTLLPVSWPNPSDQGSSMEFTLPDGLSAKAEFRDIGFGEISVIVAVNPTGTTLEGRVKDAQFRSGDAFARGWLEREKGFWLQSASSLFNCKKNLLFRLSKIDVVPDGFCDSGEVIF